MTRATHLQAFLMRRVVWCVLQVVPALDPDTPIYAGGFALQIIKRRMQEFNMWDENRFKSFKIGDRFQLGPFE
jgi:hypothetical protein